MANAKARKNFLSKVIINGDTLTSEEDIKSGVCRAYRTLLSEIEDWRPRIGDLQFRVLGTEKSRSLEKPFSKKEVSKPYAASLEIKRLRSLNSTFLVLIPKKGAAEELKDFRPISLVGSLYKLLAKVVNRQILDATLIANEAVDSRLKDNLSGLLLKLDIEKVFDHVNWECLLSIMSMMGFGQRWINWIKCHGDSRPAAFQARSGGFIEGFKVGSGNGVGRDLLHLLFVDDTLLFCKAISKRLRYLSWVFLWFEAIFGLKVNKDKSEAIPVGRVDSLANIVSILGCRIGKLPSSYLGLPLGAPFKSSRVWDVVEERFRKRLSLCIQDLKRSKETSCEGGGALEKKTHLVNWSVVCADMRQGGLGGWKGGKLESLFSRHFNDWEMEEVEGLLWKLHSLVLHRDVEDVLSWKNRKNDSFSVRSLYCSLTKASSDPFPWSIIWRSWAPMRWVLHSSIKRNLKGWHGTFVTKRKEKAWRKEMKEYSITLNVPTKF
ncbi:hypothetical protein CK203_030130 [Vitis vinifera]|uniref:Reverse transcriptase domain-containing protein n=1 Tax=Vitis vinifera TaxID=29760 RepID=A0A438I559_VITVI|nr:hypothetical protein CK203_030130 [Vitis vinifera]